MNFNNNYDDSFDDCIWEIHDIVGMHHLDDKDKNKETFVLSREDVKKLQRQLDEMRDLYTNLASDADSKDDEIDELQDRLDRCFETIPDRVGEMLNGSYFDVGTVMELEESITEILKKHGY